MNSPSLRIGLCIAALTVTILLVSDLLFEIVPDKRKQILESRKLWCESIALQFSSVLETGDNRTIQRVMDNVFERNEELSSLGLRLLDGELVASSGNHGATWDMLDTTQSTINQVRVPIYKDNASWATVEVKFKPLKSSWWTTVKESPLTQLVLITLTIGLLVYSVFIRRTMRILDPGAAVPDRVKSALDQLVEGVVLLDDRLNIVLANNAFAKLSGKSQDKLIGTSLSELNWGKNSAKNGSEKNLPWQQLHEKGGNIQAARLSLSVSLEETRILSCNVSSILDGKAKQRGLMVSFDDVSVAERANAQLKKTIAKLEGAEIKIRSQNNELRRIASIDPLTGVMNRGAFFDKLNTEFMLARQEGLMLSCIMADIDHFKNINDTFGHAVGDEVIKGMANVLSDNCHTNGSAGRYGGEEFCLVLPGINLNEALKIAEKIRSDFALWSQREDGPTAGKKITASFGISAVNMGAPDGAKMVDQADKALYISKTNGRNRVARYFDNSQMSEAS